MKLKLFWIIVFVLGMAAVSFAATNAQVLSFANTSSTASYTVLTQNVKLTVLQANSVINKKPFATISALTSATSSTAVRKIRTYINTITKSVAIPTAAAVKPVIPADKIIKNYKGKITGTVKYCR